MITENNQTMPTLIVLNNGKQHKIYEVTGETGMKMPHHISTKEAVIIVQEGSAILEINDHNEVLTEDDTFIIPSGINHSIIIQSKFKALVIMDFDSTIQFVN